MTLAYSLIYRQPVSFSTKANSKIGGHKIVEVIMTNLYFLTNLVRGGKRL
jgi:hypothetical protein